MKLRAASALVGFWAATLAGQTSGPAGRAEPLRVSSAVAPETVTVGDRFRSVIQIVAPAGSIVEFAELPVGDTLQPVDSVRVIPGRVGEPPTAAYTLAAWVAGVPLRTQVAVRVAPPRGAAVTYLVPLRLPVVRSVLPPDTSNIRPRPARGLLHMPGMERSRPWLLLLVALLAAAVGVYLLLRRRHQVPENARSPRERALAALRNIRLERDRGGDVDVIYPAVTRVLRGYLEDIRPAWGTDLTTGELSAQLEADGVDLEFRARLAKLLNHADQVKFARYLPPVGEVSAFLAGVAEWIERYPGVETVSSVLREAA